MQSKRRRAKAEIEQAVATRRQLKIISFVYIEIGGVQRRPHPPSKSKRWWQNFDLNGSRIKLFSLRPPVKGVFMLFYNLPANLIRAIPSSDVRNLSIVTRLLVFYGLYKFLCKFELYQNV